MDWEKMTEIADFILNRATGQELAVVREALKRREERDSHSMLRFNPGRMAEEVASSVNKNLQVSMDGVRDMVRDFVADIIRKNAPEVTDAELEVLCNEWVPRPEKTSKTKKRTRSSSPLPPEALLQMIEQFVAYSTGSMTPGEQAKLNEAMPNWPEKYFKAFPEEIQRLLAAYLKGSIDARTCFSGINAVLGFSE